MVKLTRKEKKMYQIFSLLMSSAIGANITTMKQISIYVANSTRHLNVEEDCYVGYNNENNSYELLLKDGRKISFSNNSNEFGFIVSKEEKDMSILIVVSEQIPGNLTTASVYSEIKMKDNGMYIVSFRPSDISDNTLKFANINYYNDNEINCVYEIINEHIDNNFDMIAKRNQIYPTAEEKYFVLSPKNNNPFDCFKGLISDAMIGIHLLYDNASVVNNCILKRKLENKN